MTRVKLFVIAGSALLTLGVSLLALGSSHTFAQEYGDAQYVGASECASCHRNLARVHENSAHSLTLREVGRSRNIILGDFSQGEDVRVVQFPGEDAPRAFTADDIAYVVGTGRYAQRYLYRVERSDYRLLPAEWRTADGTWQRIDLAESWDDPAYDWEDNCAYCHVTGLDVERGRWRDDGVQCEACHGPSREHIQRARDAGRRADEEELAAIRASVHPGTDPQICGQCHSRGTGADGAPFPIGYLPGGDLAAVFAPIAPNDMAHWWASGHARQVNMQYNEWMSAGHAGALEALREVDGAGASCLVCHSADYSDAQRVLAAIEAGDREGPAPEPLTVEMARFGVTCVSCHDPHSGDRTLPANLTQEPYALCAGCHSSAGDEIGLHHPVREMYEGVGLVEGIPGVAGAHFDAEDGPTCITCHLPTVPVDGGGQRISHALNPILPAQAEPDAGLLDGCTVCHETQVDAAQMQAFIDDVQADIRARIETARAAVTEMTPTWVTDALDFVEGDGSLGVHNYAYADAVLDAVFIELGLYEAAQ